MLCFMMIKVHNHSVGTSTRLVEIVRTNGDSPKPSQMATTALCEAEIITVSLVYPVINGLLKKHLLSDTNDLSPVKDFKGKVS